MKQITSEIENKYTGNSSKKSIKELFIMGYNFSQIHLLTTASMEKIQQSLSYEDVIERIEGTLFDVPPDILYPILSEVTGIGWNWE